MKDAEIDEALSQAARGPHPVAPALLERIARSIEPTVVPVRPLAPAWLLRGGLILIVAAVALAGAARAGFAGFEALGTSARVAIFGVLTLLACASAGQVVSEWIPGSRRRLGSVALLAFESLALLGIFALFFNDYRTTHFLAAGLTCLLTGLLYAVPAVLLALWLLRRGWVVNGASGGLAAGILAGLAGVTLLELHCDNAQALHVLVWHTAVVPVSGALGAFLGWALREAPRGAPPARGQVRKD